MSTIAAKFSSASTKFQVGVASVAVVAAATLTPAIAEATPSFAHITQGIGSSAEDNELLILPGTNKATAGDVSAALVTGAAVTVFTPFTIINGIVQTFASWFYNGVTFVATAVQAVANAVARFFRVGPYGTSSAA
jgi:ABC-type thiamin/hydroxymethylpyrimidine transport system permease subunit